MLWVVREEEQKCIGTATPQHRYLQEDGTWGPLAGAHLVTGEVPTDPAARKGELVGLYQAMGADRAATVRA